VSSLVTTAIATASSSELDTSAQIVSGTVTDNGKSNTYQLVVNQRNTNYAVKITTDRQNNSPVINDIRPIMTTPTVTLQTKTTITQNMVTGNIETITTNPVEISTNTQTQTIIRSIIKKRPNITKYKPVSSKTVSYGQTVESTVVFTSDK